MVAPEQVWQAGLAEAVDLSESTVAVDTTSLSIRQIKELLSSGDQPLPGLIAALSRDPRASVRKMAYHLVNRGDPASNEDVFRGPKTRYLAGADEAGRGALAGPLVAAAVMFEPGTVLEGVRDSKCLTSHQREELYYRILESAMSISISFIGPGLIDRWGLQLANQKALGDAIAGLNEKCQLVICDHFSLAGCHVPVYGLTGADGAFQSVSGASVMAKVERDMVMESLDRRFPRYNFKDNKGYGTREHLRALAEYGPCEVHRKTFHGVMVTVVEQGLWEE